MTLATTCPTCKTSFRVVADQLKLRRGLVRCGACHGVFSGVENLRHIGDSAAGAAARQPVPETPTSLADDSVETLLSALGSADVRDEEEAAPDPKPASAPQPDADGPVQSAAESSSSSQEGVHSEADIRAMPEPDAPPSADPAFSALSDPVFGALPESGFGARSESGFGAPAEAGFSARADAGSEPLPESAIEPPPESGADVAPAYRVETTIEAEAAPVETSFGRIGLEDDKRGEEDAIDFFATGSGRRTGLMPRTALGWSVAFVLAVALAAQLALGGRDWISARYPAAHPWLTMLAQPLGLQISLPRRPDAVTIESFELVGTEVSGSYRMNALLRSRASTALQWPAIELSLTDAIGVVVLRRVLVAGDYIDDPAVVAQGLPARSERAIRLGLELGELTPTGYSAVLFYP